MAENQSTTEITTETASATEQAALAITYGFCQEEQRISTHVCNSMFPAVSFDARGRRGVFWQDNRDGTWEIYGKVLPSEMGSRAVQEAASISKGSERPVISACSGFSGVDGGPTSPSGIIDLSYRCSSDENSSASEESDVVARLAQGVMEVNAASQTAILSAEDSSVDFYRLGVKSGTRVRIETGSNSGQEFTVQNVLAKNVLDLGYKPTTQSDVGFVFSILASKDEYDALACEFRLTCDLETSAYPDVVSDGEGRFHVVWQSRAGGSDSKWQLWYSQVYPRTIGPRMGCRNRRPHAQGGFSDVPAGTPGVVRVILPDGSVRNYVSTGDVGDYFSYGDPNMPPPIGQTSGGILTRTGVHTLFLDTGALGTQDITSYEPENPAPTPVPTPPNPLTTGNGLLGEYGACASGTTFVWPGIDMSRIDSTINFSWGKTQPFPSAVVNGGFVVRWTGEIEAPNTENYRFHLTSNYHARLFVNGNVCVDLWGNNRLQEKSSVDVPLVSGQKYDIRVEYYTNLKSNSTVMLKWSSPSTPKEIVPQSALYYESEDEQPSQLPPGSPAPSALALTTTSTTVSSATGLWTGVENSGDREAWNAQAEVLGITIDPPYVASSSNSITNVGDFGQRYDFDNVGVMFMTPPDKAVRMRRLMMPILPKYAPLVFPEPTASSQDLVPAPRRPLPPSFIDPVDISRVVQESQVRYESGPTRFTLEGDSTGTIYTNVFVNDPSGEWLRLVFQKQDLDGEYKFILGRLACMDDPCALRVPKSGAGQSFSRTYDFKLTIWQGPDYRTDQAQVASAQASATKIYEETFRFEPGDNVTIYSFPKDKLTLASGYMYFATLTPPPDFQVVYKGAAPGNVIWSTTDEGIFDQYFVPWTLPPFKGLNAPVFYDGYLGSISEGNGGGTVVPTFQMSKLIDVGESLHMGYYSPTGRIMLSTPYLPSLERPADKYWHGGYNIAGGYSADYANFWPAGSWVQGGGGLISLVSLNPWPGYPEYGRWIYETNDPNEVKEINDFFAARARFEERPQGGWVAVSANKEPYGSPESGYYHSRLWVCVGYGTHMAIWAANYNPTQPPQHTLDLLDGTGTKTQFSSLDKVKGQVPLCVIRKDAGGFVSGETFVGSEIAGRIIKASAGGDSISNPWVSLPDGGTVTGICHLDDDLFAVTSTGNVWRIASDGTASNVTRASEGLWGAIFLPLDDRYGQMAGRLLSGSSSGNLFVFDVESATYDVYQVGIAIRGFDIVRADQNMYVLDSGGNAIYAADKSFFVDTIGGIVGVAINGSTYVISWSGTGPTATEIGTLPVTTGVKGEDVLFAPGIGFTTTTGELVCDSEYNATLPFQLTIEGDNVHPRVDVDDFDNIWLTWYSNRSGSDEIYAARYDGDCATWSVPTMGGSEVRVSDHGKANSWGKFPNVCLASDGEVHLAWQSNETGDGQTDVFYTRSTGGGKKFLPPTRITDSPGAAMMPDLTVSYLGNAEKVTVAWHDNRFGDFEIMSATKSGATWRSSGQRGGDLRITSADGDSLFPRIVTDKNQNIRLVYHDFRLGKARAAIFMSTYVTLSGEWYSSGQGGKDMLVSHGPASSLFPDIDADPAGGIGPTWHDDRHALENSDYHEEIYGLYCLKQAGEAVGGPHFAPLFQGSASGEDEQGATAIPYTQQNFDFGIVDPETGEPLAVADARNVDLKIVAPGATFYRAFNEDGILSEWMPFKPDYDLETMVVDWKLTSGNGAKTVSVQVQDEFNVSYPVSHTVILAIPEATFKVEFFQDEALKSPLPKYKGWPITSAATVFIKITSDEPLSQPPTFDVITRGSHCVFNQESAPIDGDQAVQVGTTEEAVTDEGGVTGFESNAHRTFKGRLRVYRDDGIFHVDGLSRVIIHGPQGNKPMDESQSNEAPPTA